MREVQFIRKSIAVYFVCSSTWIVLSDGAMQHEQYTIDMLKGILYLTVSSIVFYYVMRRKLRDMSHHDSATDLPNMQYFDERMKVSLVKGDFRAVCIIQLDQIQMTNSFYERSQKIELIKEFACR